MNNKYLVVALSIFSIILGVACFYLGYTNSKNTTEQKFIHNYETIKSIAELGSLEVRGISKSEVKSNSNDNTVVTIFEKTFFEKMIKIEIPYIAKYGVSLSNQEIGLRESKEKNTIYITLPLVQLLSYELCMDRSDASSRRGLLVFQSDDDYLEASKKLYAESRKSLEGNQVFIKQSEEQLVKLFKNYFLPTGKIIEVHFENRPLRNPI